MLLAALVIQSVGVLALVIVVPIVVLTVGLKSPVAFQNCCALANLPFALMLTLNFFRFFSRLKDGHLFDSQTVRYLETAGKWWMLLGTVQIILGSLQAYFLSPQNLIVSGNGIVAGLGVFFVAWLLREAQELQEEQELTV